MHVIYAYRLSATSHCVYVTHTGTHTHNTTWCGRERRSETDSFHIHITHSFFRLLILHPALCRPWEEDATSRRQTVVGGVTASRQYKMTAYGTLISDRPLLQGTSAS